MNDSDIVRFVTVEGVVQGVGFRPYVARHAAEHALCGWVRNTGGQVEILISGKPDAVGGFLLEIRTGPPQSDIKRFAVMEPSDPNVAYGSRSGFQDFSMLPALPAGSCFIILESTPSPSGLSMPPADLCLCDLCLHEMSDAGNRRYRHPFISCTDCGPRYSILESYPFDRRTTSMIDFPMCPACEAEYRNPADRRYHAQTVSCHQCGPQLALHTGNGLFCGAVPSASDAILAETIRLLRAGGIVTLKGIGGYQLLCDPFSGDAVARLRVLKQRDAKPFAVMFPSADSILERCRVSDTEIELLASPAHPIVLLEPLRKPPLKEFSPLVCSGSRHIGAFLPYTPLHHLILRETGPLVATSANLSGHPIVSDDVLMADWLSAGLDGVLSNDRRIVSPQDDSVAWVVNGHPQLIRRARGYAPLSLPAKLPVSSHIFPLHRSDELSAQSGNHPAVLPWSGRTVLALGGQQKAGWCLVKDGYAHLGEYLGDLSDEAAWLAWNHSILHAMDLLGGTPDIIACDAHPRYRTWNLPLLADFPGDRIVPVQHHHAHIASVMAENGLEGPVLGVSFDGTGYGSDGSVWGGEFLLCTGGEVMRAAALKPIPMLGGDASVEEGWKSLLCHLHAAGLPLPTYRMMPERDSLVTAALRNGLNIVTSSSMGRLFDAVSALLGYAQTSRFEGECAILLEVAAIRAEQKKNVHHDGHNDGEADILTARDSGGITDSDTLSDYSDLPCLAFGLGETKDGLPFLDPAPMFSGLLDSMRHGIPPDTLAWAFHNAVACATMEMLKKLSSTFHTKDIVLSGGVFQNRLLLDLLLPMLAADGLRIHLHRQVPPNDGGLALGQAFVARRKG